MRSRIVKLLTLWSVLSPTNPALERSRYNKKTLVGVVTDQLSRWKDFNPLVGVVTDRSARWKDHGIIKKLHVLERLRYNKTALYSSMQSGIEFFTATCLNWQMLLLPDKRKDIIIDSLRFLVEDKRISLYGFVIMSNHIHLLWCKEDNWLERNVSQMFLKYTAQQLKFHLSDSGAITELQQYRSTQGDRQYHFWERRHWKSSMTNKDVLVQKLHYIHLNPVRKSLCEKEEDYIYSSAGFYYNNDKRWSFITHYMDHV